MLQSAVPPQQVVVKFVDANINGQTQHADTDHARQTRVSGAGAVGSAIGRARQAGVGWEEAEKLSDEELEAKLYPSAAHSKARPEPDCAWIHRERHRPGVTLELLHHEYLEGNPDGLRYTMFCERYRSWLG